MGSIMRTMKPRMLTLVLAFALVLASSASAFTRLTQLEAKLPTAAIVYCADFRAGVDRLRGRGRRRSSGVFHAARDPFPANDLSRARYWTLRCRLRTCGAGALSRVGARRLPVVGRGLRGLHRRHRDALPATALLAGVSENRTAVVPAGVEQTCRIAPAVPRYVLVRAARPARGVLRCRGRNLFESHAPSLARPRGPVFSRPTPLRYLGDVATRATNRATKLREPSRTDSASKRLNKRTSTSEQRCGVIAPRGRRFEPG